MDIRNAMTADPASCRPDTPVREIARLMRENDCGLIPVVDEAAKPVGTVTDRDIALRVVAEGRNVADCTARDCMTTDVSSVREDSSLRDAAELMEQEQIRRVLVVDGEGRLRGIVAQADIALSGRDRKTGEVVEQISRPKH